MTDPDDLAFSDLPLRDRLPDYLAVFGAGLAAALVLAALFTLFGPTFWGALTTILIVYALALTLFGGTQGGGYTNLGLGVLGSMSRRKEGDSATRTFEERLQKGLRPEANPQAFWSVVGGLAYLGLAVIVVVLTG